MRAFRLVTALLVLTTVAFAQSPQHQAREKIAQARAEMERRHPEVAEQLGREALRLDPTSLTAQMLIGDALLRQDKFAASAAEYEKARIMDASQHKLILDERRVLWNNIGYAYIMAKDYARAEKLYHEAIQQDPDFAVYHYNLSCAYAEQGDLERALPHLRNAWERRRNLLAGMSFPDPRKDESFKQFWADPRFQQAVRDMESSGG